MIKFSNAEDFLKKVEALGKLFEFLKKDKVVMKKTSVLSKIVEKKS